MAWTDNLKAGIAALVFIAVIAAAGSIAIDNFREDIIGDIPVSNGNDTIVLVNGTAVSLTNNWVTGITSIVVNQAGTYTVALATANYTVTRTNEERIAQITLTNAAYNGNSSHVVYTYRDDLSTIQSNVTQEGLAGTTNASGFLDTIGTLLGVTALIAIVVGAFFVLRR